MIQIARTVYASETIQLQDGTDVTLSPLPIGRLRRFMDAWGDFSKLEADNEFGAFDIYVNCCGIALEKAFANKFDKLRDTDNYITDEYREFLEEILDMDTIFKIIEICGGINLNDPKLLEAAQEALDGEN